MLRILLLPSLWIVAAICMIVAYYHAPLDHTAQAPLLHGHHAPGMLWQWILISLGELIIMLTILRPWSYHRSWGRALSAALLLLPWTLLSLLWVMHAGPLFLIHFLWVLALLLISLFLLGGSLLRKNGR